jgi:aspartyl protease family protein
MIKNIFLVSCAVLAISGLPYYAQDISSFVSSETGSETTSTKPVSYQPQTRQAQPKATTPRVCAPRSFP